MAVPLVPLAAGATRAAGAARIIGPALAALTRMFNQMRPALAKVVEALARSGRGFKDFMAQALTTEKVMAALRKATVFVNVADAAAKLAVALAGVKGKLTEAATGFGLFGKPKDKPAAEAAAPATEQVAETAKDCDCGGDGSGIADIGAQADAAAPKVGALQQKLIELAGEFSPEKVIETASSYAKLKLSLENLLGSADGAGQAFQMLIDFAGRTPVSVETATEAFRQLWMAGIKPTEENLTAFGNAAAGFNSDLATVASAISGVDLGDLSGLRGLGLQVEEQGNKLKITFDGITTTVGNSSQEVARYLEQLGKTRFADGMEQQANTFAAGYDNVKEAFDRLRASVGEAGLLPGLESIDASFAQLINRAEPLAELVGKVIGAAMKAAAAGVKLLAEHAGILVPLLAGLAVAAVMPSLGTLVAGLAAAKAAVVTFGQALLANPLGLIAGAIAAVVAALVIFKDETLTIGETSATVGEWLQATWEVASSRLGELWEWLKGQWASFSESWLSGWNMIKQWVADGVQKIQSVLAGFVARAAEILGGLGTILAAVFGALIDGIKTGINYMIAAIASVPQAVGAAVTAIKERDFSGVFQRIGEATAGNFDKDYVGDLLGGLSERIGNFTTLVADVVRFTAQGVKDDVVRFGQDVAAAAGRIAAERPAGGPGGYSGPPGRRRPGAQSEGGVDVGPAIQAALSEAEANAASVREALELLRQSPIEEVAQRYKAFQETAAQATEKINQQKEALKKLGVETPGVAEALQTLDEKLKAIADQSTAAQLVVIAKSIESIESATAAAGAALSALDAAPLSEVLKQTEDVDHAMAALDKTIAILKELLAGLNKDSKEYADIQAAIEAATTKQAELEAKRANVMAEVSEGTRDAVKALAEYKAAESAGLKVEKLTAYLAAVEKIKTEIAAVKDLLGKLEPGSQGFNDAKARLDELNAHFDQIRQGAADAKIEVRAEPFEDSIGELATIWDKFVTDAVNQFGDLFLNVLEGNVDSFDDFVDSIKKLFKKMLADMAAEALKKVINIPVTLGGEGEGASATGSGKGFNLGSFMDKSTGKVDWSRLLGTAAMGYSIGSLVGSFVGKDDNYAELGSQILGVVGAIIGGFYGAVIGAVVGALIGGLIKRGLPKTSATLTVADGRAEVEEFFSRNKGSLDQIRQYAGGVVEGINELVKLTDGVLLDLPNVSLSIKNNKFFRVVDASGIVHSFGEDYEAAINYAVLLALKGAEFSGLSPEVEAAIRNSKATDIEGLASDIEFAKEVRDIDLEPVTKDLRDVIRRFTEMSARAKELGISLDKVDTAFSKAVNEIKDDILSGLKPFQEAGLTDVEREANRITEAFEEMRENARLFNEELARAQEARGKEIAGLQEELARQQGLLAQAQQNPEDFLPPELLERLVGRGIDPDVLTRMATGGIQEVIDKLIEEIKRLQDLDAEQTPIDMSEIDRAELAARRALRERVRDSLAPYQRANLGSIEQQLLALNDTFEKLERDARAAGVSVREVNRAYEEAVKALRKQVMDQLQPYLDLAAGLTPLEVELRELDERFDEMRKNAELLDMDLKLVDQAEDAARAQLLQRFKDEVSALAGENPFIAQLEELKKKFDELTRNARALGEGTAQVDAAYQQALNNMQEQLQEGLQSYLDYGRGMSDLAVRHRDLTKFFDEQREAARALDEARRQAGGVGTAEQMVDEAEAAAFKQLADEFKASLQDLRDAGLTPTEIAVRDMRDRFAQLREDADLLGLSVDELTRLELEAIERLRGELDAQLDRYLLSDEEQQQRSLEEEFLGYLREALAIGTYKPGSQEPPEPELFPGAHELEKVFGDVKTASEELAQTFRDLRMAADPNAAPPPTTPPGTPGPGAGPTPGQTPGELVASVLDFLEPLREGRGMDGIPAEQRAAIDSASTQVSLLLEQLRLGMTDDVGALQGALGNLVTLLQQSGFEIDGSLLGLTEALASGDITGFLDELRDGVLGSTDGFGALIDILLSSGDISLPDLMHQLANGTFDAIQAMLGMTEIPPELAEQLKKIGLAYEAAQNQQRTSRTVERGGGDDASREAEQRQRDLDALLRQLEQFEDLELSPAERELKKLNEQFDEMRENATRLGVSLDRVEAAYQIAIEDFWERLLGPLNDFRESLSLSELSTLTPEQRLAEAQARFQDLAARALAGDLEAAQQLQGAAQQLLQEGQSFFASGEGYQDLFALVNSVIQQVIGNLAPGLLPTPGAAAGSFEALLAETGWGLQDRMATLGLPFGPFAGDQLYRLDGGIVDGEGTAWLGSHGEGGPALAVDLSGVREDNRALLEEVRLARQQEHGDAIELQRRVDQQSEELKEVRALLRRLTSNTQYGGRVQ